MASFDKSRSHDNAIWNLLQPPIPEKVQFRRSAASFSLKTSSTPRDGPDFIGVTKVQHVEAAEFESYLLRQRPLFDTWRRLKGADGERPLDSRQYHLPQSPFSRREDGLGNESLISDGMTAQGKSRSSQGLESVSSDSGKLLSIPNVFFSHDFHLENPRTFDLVTERYHVMPRSSGRDPSQQSTASEPVRALATNAILQEKLSWYMDSTELCLINAISVASTIFFAALVSLQELQLETAKAVDDVKTLRSSVTCLQRDVLADGFGLQQKRLHLRNVGQLNDIVCQLESILTGVAKARSLVEKDGMAKEALLEVEAVEQLIQGCEIASATTESPSRTLRDLQAAAALQHVLDELASLRSRIEKALEHNLHDVLVRDLREHVDCISQRDVLARWETTYYRTNAVLQARETLTPPPHMLQTAQLREALLPHLRDLHRARSLTEAVHAYRRAVLREIRNTIRKCLSNSSNAGSETKSASGAGETMTSASQRDSSASLAERIRALGPAEAEELFLTLYVSISETLRRFKTQSSVLLDIACSIGDLESSPRSLSTVLSAKQSLPNRSSKLSLQEEVHAALDLPSLLSQAVQLSQEKIGQLLRLRQEQCVDLPIAHLIRYVSLNRFFNEECEAISGQPGVILADIVNAQFQDFIKVHGQREIEALSRRMDTDTWQAVDFTDRDTEVLQQFLDCSRSDPPAWTELASLIEPLPQQSESKETSDVNASKVRPAVISDEPFMLPGAAVLCLETITRLMSLVVGIPSKTSAVAASLVSSLRFFDSRCRQLVLGAGARHTAGLKNINTTHLAVASRGISFVAGLMPSVREFLIRHLPADRKPDMKKILGDLNIVQRELKEHETAIYQKLIDIMTSRANAAASSILKMNWDEERAKEVGKYAKDLAGDSAKLHKALDKYLPTEKKNTIMRSVFGSYRDQLGQAYDDVVLETDAGCESLRRDVEYLVSELGKMDEFEEVGWYLRNLAASKHTGESA